MNQLSEFVNRLGLARVAAMVVVAVMLFGFFGFLMLRVTTPQMAPLYSGLSFEDSSAIVSELQSNGTPYELRGDGATILVPRDQITQTRMTLAGQGLPLNGQVGYEIFDQQSTLGATSFVQDVNLIRALEGELARTITSLARVSAARVHLVLPKRELFRRERQDPTASITLNTRGSLSSSEIRAVQHIVASAIQGMNPGAVSIIDSNGRLLAAGGQQGEDGAISGELEERTVAIENRLRSSIEELLASIVGPGRARVQVSAELDLNRLTRSSEIYDPNGQVVRSSQVRELTNASQGEAPSGEVSVSGELPGGNGGGGSTAASDESSTSEETVNYEISRSTETQITEAGAVKRLSVAVLVDGVYVTQADGASTYQARSDEELAQINALVRTAMGFDEQRGDQVEVVNMQFAERPDIVAAGTGEPGLFDFTRDDLMAAANMAVTALIGLALVFFVMRPLVRRVLEPEEAQEVLIGADGLPADQQIADAIADGSAPSETDKHFEDAKESGAAHMRALETVGNLVTENPAQSSNIVRNWLNEAA